MSSSPLPKRLKEVREALGLSQKQLGIKAGIDEFSASARMNQYETGKHTPDYLTLKNISTALNLTPSYFYAEEDLLAAIIKASNALTKKNQKALLEQLQGTTQSKP